MVICFVPLRTQQILFIGSAVSSTAEKKKTLLVGYLVQVHCSKKYKIIHSCSDNSRKVHTRQQTFMSVKHNPHVQKHSL
jgi:hypothetical protein